MDGFVSIVKPSGVTSHDVVEVARKCLGEERIGHLGTLDPMAVGVLPLACGSCRRLTEYFLGEDKRYLAEFTFGVRTDTGDLDGTILEEKDASQLGPGRVAPLLSRMTGKIMQSPPAYSALKVRGRKLVDLARRGIAVQVPPREVVISEFRLVGWRGGLHPRGIFSLTVGRGTYVRSIASSLGDELGCGAAVSYLLRTRSGKFTLRGSVTLGELARLSRSGTVRTAFSDPLSVLPDYPKFLVASRSVERIARGAGLSPDDLGEPADLAAATALRMGPFPFKAVLFSRGREFPREVAAVVTVMGPNDIAYDKVLIQE